MKLKILVSHVDVENNTVFLKFASENSKLSAELYPEVGFQLVVNNNPSLYVDDFIKSRLDEIANYVKVRDSLENSNTLIEYESWIGYASDYETPDIDPYGETHRVPILNNPEVEI